MKQEIPYFLSIPTKKLFVIFFGEAENFGAGFRLEVV
jgi:hypothetical protein